MLLELLGTGVAAGLAASLRPWRGLARAPMAPALLGCLLVLPLLWASQRALPGGLVLQWSGAPLLVMVAGWPLAVLALPAVAVAGAWLGGQGLEAAVGLLWWNGVLPATGLLVVGAALRRWLPPHLFVYILGRGFFGTTLCLGAAGTLAALWQPLPPAVTADDLVLARWLMASGEGFATGMLVAIFVAYRPGWLATHSDRLYLGDAPGPR